MFSQAIDRSPEGIARMERDEREMRLRLDMARDERKALDAEIIGLEWRLTSLWTALSGR